MVSPRTGETVSPYDQQDRGETMARITALVLTAAFAGLWAAGASAESSSKTNSSSPPPKNTTSSTTGSTTSSASAPSAPRPSTPTPAQRIDNIVNYGAVRTNQNPGPVNRVTPTGTQPMTPNAPSQANRGLRTNPVPAPTNSNARINTQGRNVNPTGDKKIAAGYDANQKRYQANQAKPKPATTASVSNTRAWPGPARPATSPAIKPSTAAAPARPAATTVARPAPPPAPARSSYTAASSSSTATSNKKK
jgi:hypothetical protein